MSAPTILIADDDTAIRTVLTQALGRAGYAVRATGNAATLWRWVAEGEGDVVLTDVVLPDENAFELLPRMKRARPNLPILVMSAKNTMMTAITAAERGAYDYLPKPFDLNDLIRLAGRALQDSRRQPAPKRSPADAEREELPIVGRSAAMQEIYRVIGRMTQTDLTVTIIGESGTGKELVARAIHDFGRRRKGPFVAVNMAAIPRDLIESELFGHEKGSFTGAAQRYAGRFEQAEGGTLFLDEIGDMPMEAQTRLLRVLQEGEYQSVGGARTIKTDVRIIAATHRDLRQLIAQGQFREDLFFRLNVVPIRLPPLRERPGDIPDLVKHFLDACVREGLPRKTFSAAAIERLMEHKWRGNVRELENLVRRTVAVHVGDEIGPDVIAEELTTADDTGLKGQAPGRSDLTLGEFAEQHLARYFAQHAPALPPPGLHDRLIREVEAPLISAALAATNGNQIKAAELLGMNRNTLRARVRDLGIRIVKTPG